MSCITVDLTAKSVEVDDYIHLHSATDFVIRNATARNFALTISTHQGIILFRISNFVDDGMNLTSRTNLESDGLTEAFRHVPHSGCRRFLLNVHDRNASFSVQFSEEIMIWNDIASSSDMSAYALKTEIPDVTRFITADYLNGYAAKNHTHALSDLSDVADLSKSYAAKEHTHANYALKTELPTIPDLSVYAKKTELFSGKYSDLTGAPDLSVYAKKTDLPGEVDLSGYLTISVAAATYAAKDHTHADYALKTELPDLTGYALKTELPTIPDLSVYAKKTELFSGNYSDLTGAPDLSVYAKKTDLPGEVDLSGYLTISVAAATYAAKEHTHADYALKTELPDLTGYLTVSVASATYAAKDHSHAGYENRLSTLETASAAIFHLGIVRPDYDDALHLQIQENGVTAVDTADAEGRAKVKVFTGQEWADFPSGGAGAPFSGMSVDIDLTSLGGGSHYLRYKWYNASTSTDWVGVTFPSSGGGGGAGGGSGEDFSVYIDPATGNWIINGEDSGVCSVGKLQVVTSIPDDPVEGMILIS